MATEAPEFAEVDEPAPEFDLRDHLELVGKWESVEVYKLEREVEDNTQGGWPQTFYPGLYFFDDCEWVSIKLSYERNQRRIFVRKHRLRAVKLASQHYRAAEEILAAAEAIFRFLIQE